MLTNKKTCLIKRCVNRCGPTTLGAATYKDLREKNKAISSRALISKLDKCCTNYPCQIIYMSVNSCTHGVAHNKRNLRLWVPWYPRYPKSKLVKKDGDSPSYMVPSGEPTFFHGKSPFLMGKSTINGHCPLLC